MASFVFLIHLSY